MNSIVMSDLEKQDAVVAAVPVVPVVTRRSINPLFPMCCLGCILFLIAATIVLALIPIYLQSRSVSPVKATVTTTAPPANPNLTFYAVTNQNQLLRYNALNPSIVLSAVTITGLNTDDSLGNIDFRPATGQLYGTSNTQLYVINEDTGVARTVGSLLNSATYGNIISMEFNPVFDVLRVVTSTGANLPVNPETGGIITTNVANPERATSVAYNNNLVGASTTTLFIINTTTNALFSQNPPNNLTIGQIGSGFGISIDEGIGFDIAPNGLALACVRVGNTLPLYLVNLNSGTFSQRLGVITQPIVTLAIPTAPAAYAITASNNNLLIINSLNSSLLFTTKTISGLTAGEIIAGLDMRPVNGQLYGLSSANRFYTINLGTGTATVVGTSAFTTPVAGTTFSFDFNPTTDQIRVVTSTGQNFRVNPNTGALIAQDANLNPGTPNIMANAYTNNFPGATSTVLYDIDSTTNRLLIQTPANAGTLVDVGPFGVAANGINGFDIGGKTGVAIAILQVNGVTSVYQINLSTGAATSVPNTVFPQAVTTYALAVNV